VECDLSPEDEPDMAMFVTSGACLIRAPGLEGEVATAAAAVAQMATEAVSDPT